MDVCGKPFEMLTMTCDNSTETEALLPPSGASSLKAILTFDGSNQSTAGDARMASFSTSAQSSSASLFLDLNQVSPGLNFAADSLLLAKGDPVATMSTGDPSNTTIMTGVVWPPQKGAARLMEVACHVVGTPVVVAAGVPLNPIRVPYIIARDDTNISGDLTNITGAEVGSLTAADQVRDEVFAENVVHDYNKVCEGDTDLTRYENVQDGNVTKQQLSTPSLSSAVVVRISLPSYECDTAAIRPHTSSVTASAKKVIASSTLPQIGVCQQKCAENTTSDARNGMPISDDSVSRSGMVSSHRDSSEVYASSSSLGFTSGCQSMFAPYSTTVSCTVPWTNEYESYNQYSPVPTQPLQQRSISTTPMTVGSYGDLQLGCDQEHGMSSSPPLIIASGPTGCPRRQLSAEALEFMPLTPQMSVAAPEFNLYPDSVLMSVAAPEFNLCPDSVQMSVTAPEFNLCPDSVQMSVAAPEFNLHPDSVQMSVAAPEFKFHADPVQMSVAAPEFNLNAKVLEMSAAATEFVPAETPSLGLPVAMEMSVDAAEFVPS